MEGDIVIGIDLGTTNSCAACFINNNLKILENREGHRTTPSCTYHQDEKDVVVGQFARTMAINRPECGISEMKRFIGRHFEEIEGLCTEGRLPFLVRNLSGKPVVTINTGNCYFERTPEQVSTSVLQKIKADVTTKLGEQISKAVITVPAHFSVSQRRATLEAAAKAGFTVLKLLNEPSAAALCYYYDTDNSEKTYTLVYDLGGGTFDVAILEKNGTNINIISVDGESLLGGHDFDNLLFNHICNVLQSKYDYDPKADKRAVRRLKNESVTIKEALSVVKETTVYLEGFVSDVLKLSITRGQFELMAENFFKRSIDIVDRCISNSKLTRQDIDEVILAGGSSRIPKIQELLSEHFHGKILNQTVNPDECVATGAALEAAMLSKDPRQVVKQFTMTEVTSASLGVADFCNEMNFIIRKNTSLPVKERITYTTVRDQQKTLTVEIYEGERTDVRKNNCLGRFKIKNLTPAPPNKCKVNIVMDIDLNGILSVTASEDMTDNCKNLEIAYTPVNTNYHAFGVDEIDNKEKDEEFSRFAIQKRYIINYCIQVKYNMKNKELTKSHKNLYDKCATIEQLVKNMEVEQEAEMKKLKTEILAECEPLSQTYNFVEIPIGTERIK